MKRETFRRSLALACVICFVCGFAGAKEGPNKDRTKQQTLRKTTGDPFRQVLNINNFMTWMAANGNGSNPPSQGGDGSAYPRGTRWVIYQDGIVWGARAYLDAAHTQEAPNQVIRIGGGTYNMATQAGAIVGTGNTGTPEDGNAPLVRIFRIRRDYLSMTAEDLAKDAAEFNEGTVTSVTSGQIDEIKAMYALDWAEWPVSKGAPYIERNGTAGYQTPPPFNYDEDAGALFTADSLISGGYDEPGLAGADPNSPADQVMWTVNNDLSASVSQAFAGSDPLGIEQQITVWGYKRADALGQLYFKMIKLINKGGVDIGGGVKGSFYMDSMYVCQWSDPDLGNYADDLSGCDSTLSLGFVYNGSAIDQEFAQFSLPPPSAGYDFLQGPAVASVGDSAIFGLKKVYDKKNLPLTSFVYFSAGSGISDPPFTYEGGLRWWRMLQGYVPDPSTAPRRLYPHPPGDPVTVFPLSGDPVGRTGFVDGIGTTYSLAPGDRRIVLNSGPFTLAPGDTQEIVVGTVGGIGADRLSSVSVMKFNDRFVQNTYNALFQVPKAPEAPKVNYGEIDGQIILEWASDPTAVAKTEQTINNPGAYEFEGYNIYQFPSANSSLAEAKRIITYDLPSDPTVILDEQFDVASGQVLALPVQFGTNSGVTRFFTFDRDFIRDIGKLYNGQEYYLAVTAYSRATQAGYLPAVLESSPQVLTVKPKVTFGTIYNSSSGDTLEIVHTGASDGTIRPIVVDPSKSTGATYEVRFNASSEWSVVNTTSGATKVSGMTNQSGDEEYPIIDGVFLKVEGPAPGLKPDAWVWSPASQRFLTFANGDYGFEEYSGTWGWETPQNYFNGIDNRVDPLTLVAVRLVFSWHDTSTTGSLGQHGGGDLFNKATDDTASYAYRYLRGASGAVAQPFFAPWIVNTGAGYAFQDYRISAPLAAYDIDANPPQRLAVGYIENNRANGLVDGYYWPAFYNTIPGGNNSSDNTPREWLFIFDAPYAGATPVAAYQSNILSDPAIPVMYWSTWNRRNLNPWPAGNTWTVTPNRPNSTSDVFSFVAPAPTRSAAEDRVSVENVGVFPNPYYAFNAAETNRLIRFVTFSNLPPKVKIRIFNLAGQPVRTLDKDDASQFLRWDLTNEDNFPVASGMYIAYVEMTLPSDGSTTSKILKLAIIQEQEILNVY